eukprot:s813_g5.t1
MILLPFPLFSQLIFLHWELEVEGPHLALKGVIIAFPFAEVPFSPFAGPLFQRSALGVSSKCRGPGTLPVMFPRALGRVSATAPPVLAKDVRLHAFAVSRKLPRTWGLRPWCTVAPLSGALGTALLAAKRRGAATSAEEAPWTTTSSGLQYRDIGLGARTQWQMHKSQSLPRIPGAKRQHFPKIRVVPLNDANHIALPLGTGTAVIPDSWRLGIQLTEKPRKKTPDEVFAEIDEMPLGEGEWRHGYFLVNEAATDEMR